MQNLSYKTLFLIIVFLLIPIVFLLRLQTTPKSAFASWWNDSWTYRQAITITVSSSASDIIDLDTNLSIGTSSLVASGKLQSDCDDLRFTDISGNILPYFIDSGCNTATTKIWLQANLVPKNTTTYTVYVYYGNPSATGTSDSNTFNLYNGLVGYWNFNENTGTSAADLSVNTNSAIFGAGNSAPSWITGKYGVGLSFDGSNDEVNLGSDSSLQITGTTISTSAWIKTTGAQGGIVSRYNPNSPWSGYAMSIGGNQANGKLAFWYGNGSNWDYSARTINDGLWHHVVVVFDSVKSYFYIDGILDATVTKTNNPSLSSNVTGYIGREATQRNLAGIVDDVRVYNRTLSSEEITKLYNTPGSIVNASSTIAQPTVSFSAEETGGGPIAWWKFDEGVGTSAFDSSGKNNHGIFGSGTSAPTWTTEDQCISGKCLRLGDNNYLTSPNLPITQLSTCLWLKTNNSNSVTNDQIIGKYDMGQTQRVFSLTQNATTNYIGFTTSSDGSYQSGNDVTSTIAINDGKWHYLCGVYDATYNRLYIDGQLHNSTDRSNDGLYNTDEKIAIGSFISADTTVANSFFKGSIDDVRIYPYARSAAQIKQDYTSGLAGQSSSNSSTNIGNQSTKGLSDGLVAYWKFDEGVGTTSTDSSGNSNLATLSGTTLPSWSTGKHGSGIGFTGIGYIASGTTPSLAPQSSNFTVSSWVKYNGGGCGSGGCGIIGSNVGYIPAYKTGYSIIATSTNFRLMFGDSTNYFDTSFGTVATNQWQHLLIVFNRTNFEIQAYIDGQLVRTQSYSGVTGPIIMETNLHIGSRDYNGGSPFNGSLDEVRIYNRALSPDEVKQLYNYSPGPIGYWKFEESSGSTAYDSSGYGRNATLQNGAIFSNGKYGKALGLNLNGPANQWASLSSISHNYGFTKSAWVYPISTSQCGETRCSVIGPYFEILSNLQYYDNNLSPVGWKTGGSIPLNQWSYITVSNDNSFLKLFVNGIQVQSVGITNTGAHSSNAIGAYSSNIRNFHGLIDEVKIYNYARTQSQILEDMNIGTSTVSSQVGQISQTIGGTTTSLEYCIPGDASTCSAPIAEWKFEEGTGTTAFDSSGTSIHNLPLLTGDSSPTWSNGKVGKALYFDGNDAIGYNSYQVANVTGPITVNAWIKTNAATSGGIVCRYGNSGSWTYCLYMNASGKLIFLRSSYTDSWSTSVTSTNSINDNQWHYVTGRFDGSTMKVYIDSQEDGSVNETRNSNGSLWSFCIGNQHYLCNGTGYNGHFTGSIDHVRIYNYARTPAQIAYDYNKGEPIAHWKLDECQGSVANDSSGMNNTGSISIGASGTQTSAGTCTTSNTAWGVGATGKINSSLNFDGVDDKVTTLSPSNTFSAGWHQGLVTNGSFSIWAKTSDYTSNRLQPLLSSTDGYSNNKGISFEYDSRTSSNKRIVFKISKGTSGIFRQHCYIENILSDNNWHHWAVSVTPVSVAFYRDGVSLGSATCSPGTATDTNTGDTTYPLSIGGNGQTGFIFGGQLDDIRIYNYALTSNQVKTLYNGGALNFR